MKLKKMLSNMVNFFDKDRQQQREEMQTLHKLLKQLKRKQKELTQRLEHADSDEQRDALQTKLDVVMAQRAKGRDHLLALREERHSANDPATDSADSKAHDETVTDAEPVADTAASEALEPKATESEAQNTKA